MERVGRMHPEFGFAHRFDYTMVYGASFVLTRRLIIMPACVKQYEENARIFVKTIHGFWITVMYLLTHHCWAKITL